ncbi:MAG: hypothetical protein KDB22_27750 [Planctomycetales bacterium]|nr:hypothetical protein [Planctomycetales bacterium]
MRPENYDDYMPNQVEPLPEIIRPENVGMELASAPPQPPEPEPQRSQQFGDVHVEQAIPPAVLQSIRPATLAGSGQEARNLEASYSRSSDYTPVVPKVSRIPLPGTGNPASEGTSEVARKPLPPSQISSSNTATKPSTEIRTPSSVPSLELPEPADSSATLSVDATAELPMATGSSLNAGPSLADLPTFESLTDSPGVSVPGRLVDGPAAESRQNQFSSVEDAKLEATEFPVPVAKSIPAGQPTTSTAKATMDRGATQALPNETQMRLKSPRLEVLLNGPQDLPVGSPARYELVVRNSDIIDLNGLILRLDIPRGIEARSLQPSCGSFDVETATDGATLLTWAFDQLAAGESAIAPIQLRAEEAKNFAVAMEWTLIPITGDTKLRAIAPRVEVALEGPSEVLFGEPNIYRLHIRNPGNATASNVEVRLTAGPYGESASKIGDIASGSEESVDVELTFNERGAIDIAAIVTADGNLTSNTQIEVLVRQAQLSATITAPTVTYLGTSAQYLVEVTNDGDVAARDVQAQLMLPAGARINVSPADAPVRDGKIDWRIASLQPGETRAFPMAVDLPHAGDNSISLICRDATGHVLSSAEAITQVEAVADLKLTVNDPVAPAPVGSEVAYELTLTNRGAKACHNVTVVAQFSNGIEPTRGEGQKSRIIPGQLIFEPIAVIEGGQTVRLAVFAQASGDGMHRFRVEVRTDATDVRLVQEESTRFIEGLRRIASPVITSPLR